MLRLLKLNKKVIAIFAVNIQDWQDSTLIWVWSDERETGVSGPGGQNGETRNNGLGSPAFSVVPIGVGTSIDTTLPTGALGGVLGAIKSKFSPAMRIFSRDGPNKDSEVKPLEFPFKTDIYPLSMALLPSSDDTNGEVGKAQVSEPQTDETVSTSDPLGTESFLGEHLESIKRPTLHSIPVTISRQK